MRRMLALVLAIGLPAAAVVSPTAQSAPPQAAQPVTRAQFERWKTELSNWGRWGKDDQLGALNLITPAKRRQAAALVREGFSVSLSRDADMQKAIDNPDPFEHSMIAIGADRIGVIPHGVAHTHLDSLAHIHYDGVFYNGYKPDADNVLKNRPCQKFDHQSQERDLHEGHPRRSPSSQRSAVSGTWHSDLRRRISRRGRRLPASRSRRAMRSSSARDGGRAVPPPDHSIRTAPRSDRDPVRR